MLKERAPSYPPTTYNSPFITPAESPQLADDACGQPVPRRRHGGFGHPLILSTGGRDERAEADAGERHEAGQNQ
jgi:hypothetical protein